MIKLIAISEENLAETVACIGFLKNTAICLGDRFIAKTLYGEEEEDDAPQNNTSVEEPKLLGIHPVSGEKVMRTFGHSQFIISVHGTAFVVLKC